jgi:serine/threonine protein kinase HipA of HipAB toxin-antitoxin module
MSDSEVVHGKRTVTALSASQIQHKRDLDRKAQRAMRQRTKLRIQELENDISGFRSSSSQREKTMIDEIQMLRNHNRQLKASLEKIG